MKKILMFALLLSSFAFGKSIEIQTGKLDGCTSSDYKMYYQGIDSYNEGYYAHTYEYANCKIDGYYFTDVQLAIITENSNEFTNTISSLTFYPKKSIYYFPSENRLSFNISKVASWKR